MIDNFFIKNYKKHKLPNISNSPDSLGVPVKMTEWLFVSGGKIKDDGTLSNTGPFVNSL